MILFSLPCKLKQWTLHNKLPLNEDKTDEARLIDPSKFPSHPKSLMIGQNAIMFSDSARNLGVMFHKTLSMKAQVGRVCQGAYLEKQRLAGLPSINVLLIVAFKLQALYSSYIYI